MISLKQLVYLCDLPEELNLFNANYNITSINLILSEECDTVTI